MKKTLTLVLSLALAVAIGIGGTLAWLTSSTGPVTNTFTVGKLAITLDEAPVDANGKTTTGDRGAGNSYKLMPGHTYDKACSTRQRSLLRVREGRERHFQH